MAEFKLDGRSYVVSRELIEPVIPKMPETDLLSSLDNLGRLEAAKEQGLLVCSQEAWDELVELGKAFYFEVKWRRFVRPLGITLEVR